jgi:hypothetical protein
MCRIDFQSIAKWYPLCKNLLFLIQGKLNTYDKFIKYQHLLIEKNYLQLINHLHQYLFILLQ